MPEAPKILIIEDDPDQVLMYTVEFNGKGFEVLSATTGDEGVKQAVEKQPSAILLDIHMEDRSGLDVLRELKEKEETKKIPVIVFTNFSKANFEETAMKLGADKFIVKMNRVPRLIVQDVQEILGQPHMEAAQPKVKHSDNVLMVEDNPFHREMYTTKFYLAGYSLITAATGEKALEQVAANKIDLILLDLALPGMSGVDVLKKLKADEKTRDIPVIAFTVTAKSELATETRKFLEDNTVAYFEKMTSLPTEAVELVENVLAKIKRKPQ
jgi:CheY-like chemotaxis protein